MDGNYIYGLNGIMMLFNCSKTTALKLKKGVIAPAVTQVGRKIVVDWKQALELAGRSSSNTLKKE